MLYVAIVALLTITSLVVVLVRVVNARNLETVRADANVRGWQDTRLLLSEVQRERDNNARDLTRALIRLEEIRKVVTRRPPRRRWLRIAHRVAGLTDTTTRGVLWPA